MIKVRMGLADIGYKDFSFPVGETQIVLGGNIPGGLFDINFEFENEREIIKLLLIVDAIRGSGADVKELNIPYIPYGRQDRRANPGECFSLQVFSRLINSLNIPRVVTYDTHSDVSKALINNLVEIPQWEIFKGVVPLGSLLICPDGGALKKTYKLASVTGSDVVECSKIRNTKTGEITGVKVHETFLSGKDCYIVDDICDGGRTFIEIAKELKKLSCGKIILCVTHGFFTKGLGVFDGLIDEIYTRKGKAK